MSLFQQQKYLIFCIARFDALEKLNNVKIYCIIFYLIFI